MSVISLFNCHRPISCAGGSRTAKGESRVRALGHRIRARARSLRECARNEGEGRSSRRNGGGLTDTRRPKWSEMMLTARRMPCCDTMAARRAAARDALGFFCARCGGRWWTGGLAGSPRLNPRRRDGGRMGWGIYVMDGQDRAHLEWPVIEELRRQQSWRKPPVRPSRAFSACPLSSTVLLQPLYKSILKSRN